MDIVRRIRDTDITMATIRAYEDLVTVLRTGLLDRGQSARGAALAADLPIRAIQGVLEGHEPRLTRVIQVADALGYELRLVPRGGPEANARAPAVLGAPTAGPARPEPAAPVPGLRPVRDRELAELLAAIAGYWEELGRPELRRELLDQVYGLRPRLAARGSRLADVVAWLGWRVIPGGPARRTDDGR